LTVTRVLLKGMGGQIHDLRVAYGTGLMDLPGSRRTNGRRLPQS
jgi:hypothetical protein